MNARRSIARACQPMASVGALGVQSRVARHPGWLADRLPWPLLPPH